ncbi:hypothetical protein [Deinococcus sp.]|uniref:hypothetical protein n=1 Tax=Deinococcus sp. TaxID=47478 RepID=UPI003CC694BF
MTRYRASGGGAVVVARALGSGGEGTVYSVENQPGVVAKVYTDHPTGREAEKIVRLVEVKSPRLEAISAWPRAALYDERGSVRGVLMPYIDFAQASELHNLYGPSSRRRHFPGADWRFLVHVARNLARAFAELHAEGHLMGDVSSRNILVSRQGTVRFVDTDSFQIRAGGQVYPCPVGTAECTPPELQGLHFGSLIRTPDHDRFGLALMIFSLLFEGRHPYAGVHDDGALLAPAEAIARHKFAYSLERRGGVRPPPGTLTLKALPPELRALFERAFSPQPGNRPAAEEWEGALAQLSAALTKCERHPEHLHWDGVACPWCALFPAGAGASTVKTHLPGAARTLNAEAELNRIWTGLSGVPIPPAPKRLALQVLPPPFALALPPEPAQTPFLTSSRIQRRAAWGRQLWGVALVMLGFLLRLEGLPLLFSLVAFLFGWLSIRAGNPKRWERSQRRRAEREGQAAQKLHQRQLLQVARELEGEVLALGRQLQVAEEVYRASSALARWRAELERLERRRHELLALARQEGQKVEEAVWAYGQRTLEIYLSLHAVQPGMLPGFGPALVTALHGGGVLSAREVELARLRRISGIGPKRTQELLWWRRTLEQFFSFDPRGVPPSVIQAARDAHARELGAQLQVLETEIPGLHHRVQAWMTAEAHAAEDVLGLLREIEGRRQAIALLRSRAS